MKKNYFALAALFFVIAISWSVSAHYDHNRYCASVYSPVCGKDGETYSNACEAIKAGTDIDYHGRCRDDDDYYRRRSRRYYYPGYQYYTPFGHYSYRYWPSYQYRYPYNSWYRPLSRYYHSYPQSRYYWYY